MYWFVSISEDLDEHNPWFCPKCCKPQRAHKTIAVCRYPDTLIVYLKRWVNQEWAELYPQFFFRTNYYSIEILHGVTAISLTYHPHHAKLQVLPKNELLLNCRVKQTSRWVLFHEYEYRKMYTSMSMSYPTLQYGYRIRVWLQNTSMATEICTWVQHCNEIGRNLYRLVFIHV